MINQSSKIKIRETAKECVPNMIKNESSNAGANKAEKWLTPVNCMPVKQSANMHEKKAADNKNHNKYNVLHDDNEQEENEEFYKTLNEDKWSDNNSKERKIIIISRKLIKS